MSRALLAIFAVTIVLLLGLIAHDSTSRGQDAAFPTLLRNVWSLGVAISELDYHTKGMVGLQDVYDALVKGGFDIDGSTVDPQRLAYVGSHSEAADEVISQAAHLPHVDRTRTFIVYANETGSVDYYELAFRLFGHHVTGFYWLWFAMVAAVSLCFLVSFWARPVFLFPAAVYLVVLLVYVHRLDVSNLQLATPANPRCLPVTALYPILYILTLAAAASRFRWFDLVAGALCALIYAFIVNARTAALWELGGPAGVLVLATTFRFFPRLQVIWGARHLARYALWPLVMFCAATLTWMAAHQAREDRKAYAEATVFGHEYWCNILYPVMHFYRADLPELERRSGVHIGNNPDSFVGALTKLKIAERGENVDDYVLAGRYWNVKKWDKVCREIVFDNWRDHTDRMIQGYLDAFHLLQARLQSYLLDDGLALLILPSLLLHWLLRWRGSESLAPLLPALIVLAPLGGVAAFLVPLINENTDDYFMGVIVLLIVSASVPWRRERLPGREAAQQW
jgi:hypothetical protein